LYNQQTEELYLQKHLKNESELLRQSNLQKKREQQRESLLISYNTPNIID
jgi:hypothetical protein